MRPKSSNHPTRSRAPICLVAAAALACSGCVSGFPVLPAANVPLFTGPGEVRAFCGGNLHPLTLEANLAVSPLDHVAVLGAVSYNPPDRQRRVAGELAAGGYLNLGALRLEGFAGAGYGESAGAFGLAGTDIEGPRWAGDFSRLFLQLDGGFAPFEFLSVGGMFRLSRLTAWVSGVTQTGRQLQETKGLLAGEWAAVVRAGWPALKLEVQAHASARLDGKQDEDEMGFVLALMAGLCGEFDLW